MTDLKETLDKINLAIDALGDLEDSTSINFDDYSDYLSPSIESMHTLRRRLERQVDKLECEESNPLDEMLELHSYYQRETI